MSDDRSAHLWPGAPGAQNTGRLVEPQNDLHPQGRFQMGSPKDEPNRNSDEGPIHWVTISAFQLAETEVTFAEYDRFVEGTGNRSPDDSGWVRGKRPVIDVSWNDAQAYIKWLNKQTGGDYRLPTETEWEYAYRAGTTTPFYTSDCIDADQANYNYNDNSNYCGAMPGVNRNGTVPVDELNAANPWGLRHMTGNV